MKKVIFPLVAIALFAACTNQKPTEQVVEDGPDHAAAITSVIDTANAPVFKFEKESYDFGQIAEGEQVNYSFVFKNIGKTPLIISDAAASCGCTVPEFSREPIAPNQEGKISVVFNSSGRSGMQNKVITVIANTVPAETELHLIGDVKPRN
ncbi:MAG TPA: DUF1573 domain-containing protein [Daejeonella sp.]|nr:DUF1573 domain-containing protein [Daejeonella sp.]